MNELIQNEMEFIYPPGVIWFVRIGVTVAVIVVICTLYYTISLGNPFRFGHLMLLPFIGFLVYCAAWALPIRFATVVIYKGTLGQKLFGRIWNQITLNANTKIDDEFEFELVGKPTPYLRVQGDGKTIVIESYIQQYERLRHAILSMARPS